MEVQYDFWLCAISSTSPDEAFFILKRNSNAVAAAVEVQENKEGSKFSLGKAGNWDSKQTSIAWTLLNGS